MGSVLRRFYLVRPLAAVLLCLPGILLVVWYSWEAYSSFSRYRWVTGEEAVLTVEDFHLQLHDTLKKDYRRIWMPTRPKNSKLPEFSFHISPGNLSKLYEGAELDSGRPYVPTELEDNGKLVKAEIRLRGSRHWHNLGRQKSIKVRLPKGKLIRGSRVFSLINDPAPMVVGESLILQLARKKDVLTPKSAFARVLINGSDLGVFRYETHPDESLLRNNRMVPGSIYSGNLPGSAKTEELWSGTSRWAKPAWRVDAEKDISAELDRLLKNVKTMTVKEFADFARREMDLKAFATFDALDVTFGGDQHDYRQNHKLHFDPYTGMWEPVAWNFRGFKHDPYFNLVENPVLMRLKLVPEYVSQRNEILYKLLVGKASVSSLRSRGLKTLLKLRQELASDRFFDAYKMLPRTDRFHRQMVRPMTLEKAALVFESELTTYKRRHNFLLRELKKNPMRSSRLATIPHSTSTQPSEDDAEQMRATDDFQVVVDGRVGVTLTQFNASWNEHIDGLRWRILLDGQPITAVTEKKTAPVLRDIHLYPSVGFVEREDGSKKRGKVRSVMVPTIYRFEIESSGSLSDLEAVGIHMATGSRVRTRPAEEWPSDGETLGPDEVPTFDAGEVSPHPGTLKRPGPETIRLGPGTMEVPETITFASHQRVEVAAGTHFRMGEDASLVFLGEVRFNGIASDPIVVKGADNALWGGIAVQGKGTRGSRFEHVEVKGGTKPRYGAIPYPAMINVHDTRDVSILHCRFGENRESEDVLHVAYVKDLEIEFTTIKNSREDAIDLEFVTAKLTGIKTVNAGDDGLDLMGTDVAVKDSSFISSGGNGISAGEESEVMVFDSLVAGAKVGVLAKNASTVELFGSLLYENRTGVRIYRQTTRYAGDSRIASDRLFIVRSEQDLRTDKESKNALEIQRVQRRLPKDGSLNNLLTNVLDIHSWSHLQDHLADERAEVSK